MTQERIPRSGGSAPAFPNDQGLMISDRVGMSKREHFAVLLLAGFNANPSMPGNLNRFDLIGAAVGQADALIEELARADREDA